MTGCITNFKITQYDGTPAPFASVDVYEVKCFLWYCYDASHVASFVTRPDGTGTANLTKGQAYHIHIVGRNAAGQQKVRDVYRTPDSCPYYLGAYLPA